MKIPSTFIFVIILFLLMVFPQRVANSCGEPAPVFQGYSILNPKIFDNTIPEKPLTFTYHYLPYGDWWKEWNERKTNKNLTEWQNHFCGNSTTKDLSFLIYKSSIGQIKELQKLQSNRNSVVPEGFEDNSIVDVFKEYKFPLFFDYLIYAKQCEPHLTKHYTWKRPEPDLLKIKKLIQEGTEHYYQIDDDFFKLRYAYQILRLSRVYGDDLEVTYNQFIKPLRHVKSIIQNLCLEHLGGWLSLSDNKDKEATGNALLAKSLLGNQERGINVFLSFKIDNQAEWNKTLRRCSSDREKAMVYYLRALDKHSIALDDMKMIYRLFPNAQSLEILMMREMQKIELRILENKIKTKKNWHVHYSDYGISPSYVGAYLEQIKPFVKRVAMEKKCKQPAFWMMMEGYLEYITYNNREAQAKLKKAKSMAKKGTLLFDQIELLEFATLLSLMNTMESWMEEKMWHIMKNNKAYVHQHQYEPDFFMEKLASLYTQKGDLAKAYLCNYWIYGLKYYSDAKEVKAILSLWDKPDKNDFEKYLLKDDYIKTREELVDLYGTALIGEDKFNEAIKIFKTIPDFGESFKNPFLSYAYKFNVDKRYPNVKKYSKYEIVQKLVFYENQINQNTSKIAEAHLAMGNYYYNTSYFGFAWKVKDYFISVRSRCGSDTYGGWVWSKGNKEYMNLTKARFHLNKVLELTENQELRAQAIFMLSWLHQANEIIRKCKHKNYKSSKVDSYRKWLVDDFMNTKFMKETIKECPNFKKY